MTDPLDALRDPIRPVDPDPAFARALRTRVERALLDLPEAPVTAVLETPSDVRLHTLTPRLSVVDARAAVAFYVDAFGARRRDEPFVLPDGRVGHVEVALGDSVLMLADEYPEMGLLAPLNRGGPSQSLRLEVSDPDAVVAAAVRAGARLELPVTDEPYGRTGSVIDPSGHRWVVAREAPAARPGEVVFASLWTRYSARAERFYPAVLGWELEGDHAGQGRQVTNLAARTGLFGGQRPTLLLCYAVPDVDAAVRLVRAAGGTAEEPADRPYGRIANCADDQGLPFAVSHGPGAPGPSEPGGLSYVDFRMPDAGRARAFYGTVLGWGFEPGGQDGYWHPMVGGGFPSPMAGLVGGHPEATVTPTFGVPDVATACAAVRAAGGSAPEPVTDHHGTSAFCSDDQGAAFGLSQITGE
jgi:predicted enzyme related to lactoylglutathione lyase